MKKSVILTVLSILLLPLAFAAHDPTITSSYTPVYETNPANITAIVENGLFSSASINNVNILTDGFAINNIVNILGWTLTNNVSINFNTNTNAISNWGMQRFGFSVVANNVAQDTTYDWTIATTDTSSDSQTNILQFTVLNDNTPPAITATTPGPFILGGNELFSATANDPETGIANANLHLSNCDLIFNNATNSSSTIFTSIPLTCAATCSINQDLTSWNEGDVCFYYDVSNRGGETAVTNNLTTIIDRTPPTVTLIAPSNAALLNVTLLDLQFNAIDNYDNNLDCNVIVNGNSNPVTGIGNLTYNLAVNDGIYTWSASCTDEVGLTGNSASQTFTIDNQGPNVTINVPAVNDRGNNVLIDVSIVDDGSGVDQNSITAEIIDTNGNSTQVTISNNQIIYPTTSSTIPGTYTVIVSAKDNLGQQTTQQAQFRIRETYTVTVSLSQNQVDASTPNLTRYVDLTGKVVRDDGAIPSGTVDVTELVTSETLNIDNSTGNFETDVEIPQATGGYTVTATFTNGPDVFTGTAAISVGPYCGNGVIDSGEQCDTTTAAVCSDYGFSQGTTSCNLCTIVTSSCSNPPAAPSSGGGGSHSHSSSNNVVYIEPPIVEETHTSGIIEPIAEKPVVQPVVESHTSGIIEPVQEVEQKTGFGIGAAWAALTNFTLGLNKSLLLALLVIAGLLYVLGWRKKEDDWDDYFKRHGQH